MKKVYVVFEGRVPGLYAEWKDCSAQVDGWSCNVHKAYDSFEEAEAAYVEYCKNNGREYVKGETSNSNNDTQYEQPQSFVMSSSNMVEDTTSQDIALQYNIQKQLEIVLTRVRFPMPVYTLHEENTEQDFHLVRYRASLPIMFKGKILVDVGCFAKSEYDAKEDVVVLLMRRVLNATGRRVRDYNYYNVQLLSDQLQYALDENFALRVQIGAMEYQAANH